MARYMQIASDMRGKVDVLAKRLNMSNDDVADLAYIINLAVRACPRAVQSTVRGNIVGTAVKDYCDVAMTKETDKKTGRQFNKIVIRAKGSDKLVQEVSGGDELE